MKNVTLLLVASAMSVIASGAWAQSNTLLVYGNVSYDSQKVSNANTSAYTFSPAVGYQWDDTWTGGINLGLAGTEETFKSSSISVGPFIRYTLPLTNVVALYGQFNANYLSGNAGSLTYTGFQGTLFPAIGIHLKNGFALNFTVGSLSFTTQKTEGLSHSQSNFHLGFGNGAGFGISKNFSL